MRKHEAEDPVPFYQVPRISLAFHGQADAMVRLVGEEPGLCKLRNGFCDRGGVDAEFAGKIRCPYATPFFGNEFEIPYLLCRQFPAVTDLHDRILVLIGK